MLRPLSFVCGAVLALGLGGVLPCGAQSVFQSLTGNVLERPAATPPEADEPSSADPPDPNAVNWDALNDPATPATDAERKASARGAPPAASGTTWKRSENPDGSAAVTAGTRLPTELDANVGMDMHSADRTQPGPGTPLSPEQLQHPAPPDRGSGVAWANVTFAGWPVGTSVEARVDPMQEQSRLGTTVSRTVPVGTDLAVTVQNGYSVSEALAGSGIAAPGPTVRSWDSDGSARLSILTTGTSFSAGARKSSADGLWLHSVSAEQKLSDHLSVTGAVSETPTGALDRSLKAGFKQSW